MSSWRFRGVPIGAALVLAALTFTACSDDDEKTNEAPVAAAGADVTVAVGQTAALTGAASSDPEGATLTYQWTLASRPTGSSATLTGATTATPSLVTDEPGAFAVDLVVSDGTLSSGADRVIVTATNLPPVVNAGADGTVVAGTPLALGATVTDPDGHAIVSRTWTLVSKPLGSAATLAPDAALDASLAIDVAGTYVVRLEASDDWSTASDERTLTATSPFTGGELAAATATANAELLAVAARLDALLALGYNTINADAVMKRLTGKDGTKPADSLTVIDVRLPADFAKGHIPGAINIPFAQLPDVLLGNPAAIGTKQIAVASYNGNDGTMANLLINLARVPEPVPSPLPNPITWPISQAIFGGMAAWTFDRELSPTRFDDDLGVRRIDNGALSTVAVPGVDQGAYPGIGAFSGAADTATKKALVRARQFLAGLVAEHTDTTRPYDAFWTDFVKTQALLADGNAANDPVVVSVRNLADYNKGHVPGVINTPYGTVAKAATYRFFDPARTYYLYCYTGHTGGIATMTLGIMGYKVRNLLYGFNGWTLSTAAASGQLARFDVARAWDFPLHDTGFGETIPVDPTPAAGCKGCHANLDALYAEFNYTEPPAPGVVSEGEG